METTKPKSEPTLMKLKPIEATQESFKDYGQVIEVSSDGEEFGPNDAQLDLSKGIPRFNLRLTFFLCLCLKLMFLSDDFFD